MPVGPSTAKTVDASTFNATYPSGYKIKDQLSKQHLVAIRARADCLISIKQASLADPQTIELIAHEERSLQITEIVSVVSGTPGFFELIY